MDFESLSKWVVDFYSQAHPIVQFVVLTLLVSLYAWLVYANLRKRHKLDEAKLQRDKLAHQVRERDLTIRELETKVKEADARYGATQQEIVSLSEAAGRLEQQVSDGHSQLEDARRQLARCQEEFNALQKRFDDLGRVDTRVWQGPAGEGPPPASFVPRADRPTRFIAFLNLKGGVGKTTLVANLGAAYATGITGTPLRVLVVDLDYQGTLSNTCVKREWLLERRNPHNHNTSHRLLCDECLSESCQKVLAQLKVPLEGTSDRGQVIIADEYLEQIDFRQQAVFVAQSREVRFHHRKVFHDPHVFQEYDLIFFDCPPRLTTSAVNALLASDYVVVPTSPHPNDVDAVPRTLRWMSNLGELDAFKAKLVGVVLNRTFRRGTVGNLTQDEARSLEKLQHAVQQHEPMGNAVLEHVVPHSPDVARYAAGSLPLGSQKQGHQLYEDVAAELYQRIRK